MFECLYINSNSVSCDISNFILLIQAFEHQTSLNILRYAIRLNEIKIFLSRAKPRLDCHILTRVHRFNLKSNQLKQNKKITFKMLGENAALLFHFTWEVHVCKLNTPAPPSMLLII